VCFQDYIGQFLLGKSDYSPSSATILKAETLSLLEALKVAISNGMHFVLFETDSKILSDTPATNNSPINEFGDLVSQCRSLLLNINDFVVSYVRRQTNKVPYSIIRASLSHISPIFFMMYQLICTRVNLEWNELALLLLKKLFLTLTRILYRINSRDKFNLS